MLGCALLLLGRALLSRLLLCLLALLHLLRPLLLHLLVLRVTLLPHLLPALVGCPLLGLLCGALLICLLALRLALLLHLLATLLDGALADLLLLRGALLFGLLALHLTLLACQLAALLDGLLLRLLLLHGAVLFDLLALRVALLAYPLPALVDGCLSFLERALLVDRGMLTGGVALRIGLDALRLLLLGRLLPLPVLHKALLLGNGALLRHVALGLPLHVGGTLFLLSCLIDLAGAIAVVGAARIRCVEVWRATRLAFALPRGEALSRLSARDPLRLEALAFDRMALAIGLPVRHALPRLAPVGAGRGQHRPAFRPLRRCHALSFALPRGNAQGACPGIVA